jgi:hypothetical protein
MSCHIQLIGTRNLFLLYQTIKQFFYFFTPFCFFIFSFINQSFRDYLFCLLYPLETNLKSEYKKSWRVNTIMYSQYFFIRRRKFEFTMFSLWIFSVCEYACHHTILRFCLQIWKRGDERTLERPKEKNRGENPKIEKSFTFF